MTDLFDFPPYQKHSETSFKAAEAIEPPSGRLRKQVYEYICRHPHGLTDEQMQIGMEMNPSTQRPRRVELVDKGHIVDSGTKRQTRSGRAAVVWVKVQQDTST